MDKAKVIISDCHLSAGRFFENGPNPHEDFHFDDEMIDLIEYFSHGEYGDGPKGPVPVELIIAGDFLDFLNVPVKGEFEDAITEKIAIEKCRHILNGHPGVMDALKRFASKPGKKITYLIGNHDADLFFDGVRELITRRWDPQGDYPSQVVELVADRDHLALDGGVEIHHGNQLEAGSVLNFDRPLLEDHLEDPVLNLPWSSLYVLKIINRLRWEREFVDKVRPVKVFVLFGFVLDPWFTIRFVSLTIAYFIKTRFIPSPKRRSRLRVTLDILKRETKLFLDLEEEARELLNHREHVKTIIFGHTHHPMNKVYPDGKQYINTGTWTKMINLDWGGLGQQIRRTFALIRYIDGRPQCDLRQWMGEAKPHKAFDG